jgi:hypothetical protein
MKTVISLILFVLLAMQTYAVQFTVGGVTYDDLGSDAIHEGLYRNVTVVGLSSDFAGELVIPDLPAYLPVAGITIYFRVTAIGSWAFYNTNITSVTLPHTVTNIHTGAFNGCTASRIEVSTDNPAYASSDGVLYNKNQNTLLFYPVGKPEESFAIPATVTALADGAFHGSALRSITLPESLTTIGYGAFFDCLHLTSLRLPRNVSSIDAAAFKAAIGLTALEVAPENLYYSSSDGVLYNKAKTTLCCYPSNKAGDSFTIPATVTAISDYAFMHGLHLLSINGFLANIATIGPEAFSESKIRSVTLPGSVRFIDFLAFYACADLADLTVFWQNPSEVSADESIFIEIDKSAVRLHVPPGTEAAYRADPLWTDFNIMDDATGIEHATLSAIGVFPNPASDFVMISGLSINENIDFYTVNGQLLFTRRATEETENIPVAHLPAGAYLVKTGNGQALKWVKK